MISKHIKQNTEVCSPLIDDWTEKMWYMYTVDTTLPFGTRWMGPESIVLSEISQTENAKNDIISLMFGM